MRLAYQSARKKTKRDRLRLPFSFVTVFLVVTLVFSVYESL